MKPEQRSGGRLWLRRLLALLLVFGAAYLLLGYYLESTLAAATKGYSGPSLRMLDHLPTPLADHQVNGWDAVEAATLLVDGQRDRTQGANASQLAPNPEVQEILQRFRSADKERARPTPEDLALFRATVEKVATVFAILDPALANAQEARFLTDYQVVPLAVEIPNLLASLRLAALLRARAEVALADGEANAAWRNAAGIYRLAYWNATTMNTLIGVLVGRAIAQQGDQLVQTLLGEAPAGAEARQLALAEARRLEPLKLFAEALAAERAASFSSLIDPRFTPDILGTAADSNAIWPPLRWAPYRKWLAGRYLEWSVATNAICEQPSYQRSEKSAELAAPAIPAWAAPAESLTFDCSMVGIKRDLWQASKDQLEIAMELETYRGQQGQYPPTLAAAGAQLETRLDPFSNQPYLYLPNADAQGYKLYSVAANGRDDGGIEVPGQNNQPNLEAGDWVWQVASAKPRPSAAP